MTISMLLATFLSVGIKAPTANDKDFVSVVSIFDDIKEENFTITKVKADQVTFVHHPTGHQYFFSLDQDTAFGDVVCLYYRGGSRDYFMTNSLRANKEGDRQRLRDEFAALIAAQSVDA